MRILLLSILVFFTSVLSAQRYKQKWTLGLSAGISQYNGDIYTPIYKMDSTITPSFGVSAMYHANDRIGFSVYGQITGLKAADSISNNPYWEQRNLSFKTLILEAGARLEFSFLPYAVNKREPAWAPYISIGAFISSFNPITEYQGQEYELVNYNTNQDQGNSAYSLLTFGPTLGGGVKYNYKENYTVGIHFDYKYTNTDYLDDISGNYSNPSDLLGSEESEITLILHDRSLEDGGPGIANERKRRDRDNKNDRYFTLSVFGTYTFQRSYCPKPGSKSF